VTPNAVPDSLATRLREFGPLGILAILVIVAGALVGPWFAAMLVLVWARWSQTPWRDLGFVRPASWTRTIVFGVLFGVALKVAMKAVVMPLFGAPPINQTYHYLEENAAAIPGTLLAIIVGAGFGEEVVYRAWLFERSGKRFGTGRTAKTATVLITAVLFGAAHYTGQGKPGVEQATVVGLVLGTIYARTGKIWFPMIAHAAFDLTAVAMIYRGWETTVAHWVFG
jgi:uncharacterized protein